MTRIPPLFALLALAACARSEEASLVPPDSNQGYNQVGRVGTPEQDDREPAIGEWRPSLQDNVQALEFGPIGTPPLFSLRCASTSSVLVQRHGGVPSGPLPLLEISRGSVSERLPVTLGTGAVPTLRAEIALASPLASVLAGQEDVLAIRLGDTAPVYLPPSPLVGDYLRSCQTATPLPTSAAPTAANGNSAAPAPAANAAAPAANGAQPKQ